MRPPSKWLPVFITTVFLSVPAVGHAQDAPADFIEVIADLRENSMSSEEIRTTDQFESVAIVDLDGLDGEEFQTLQETLRKTEDGFADVQTAIEANELFEGEIARRSVPLREVFAITRNDAGAITVYLR